MAHFTRRRVLGLGAALAAAPLAARAASHATHDIVIENFAFSPAELTMMAGDRVRFTNADGAPHTATADNGSFDTGRLSRGQAVEMQFTTPGTYSYFCAIHPRMKGVIIVT